MGRGGWRDRAGTEFAVQKQPVTASRGVVVANHPLGAAAGAEMLAAGGNAVDAAVAVLFALTVVEPMMVGICGAGIAHLAFADGRDTVLDSYAVAPGAAHPTLYRPRAETWPDYLRVEGDLNLVGPLAVGVPGTLKGWCEALTRFGRLDLESVLQPAIRHAERGFRASAYLVDTIGESAAELARFPETARTFLPRGTPPRAGDLIVQRDYAHTLRLIAAGGPDVLYGGALGVAVVEAVQRGGGILTLEDLVAYRTVERRPLRGSYRDVEVAGAPPPTAGGVHLIEMLNVLEGLDVAALGYGTPAGFHLLAEVLKLGFADRHAATGDPAFVSIPVERLCSKAYAAERRAGIRPDHAGVHPPGVPPAGSRPATGSAARLAADAAAFPAGSSPHTTHVTAADADGNVVSATQTINNLFGAKLTVPGTGVLLNNTMALFDPHPGHAASIAPGKRMTSSMAPTIVRRGGRPVLALGLPGGVRIFPSVLQVLVNLVDHGMSLQEAVEAPRVWTQGQELEVESGVPEAVRAALAALGHPVIPVGTVGGGTGAIAIETDGTLAGVACWRADGTAIGVSGGAARPGVRFRPTAS